MKTVGKVVLAIILGFAGLMAASFIGGALAGMLGGLFRLNANTVGLLEWVLPKVIFLGTLISLYVYLKRKKVAKSSGGGNHGTTA
jgi:hypothetical protein